MEWIKVSDGLPSIDADYPDKRLSINVLLWVNHDEENAGPLIGFFSFNRGYWLDSYEEYRVSGEVTHWAPITPPKDNPHV